jgi:tripeptidyl-peptidase-1
MFSIPKQQIGTVIGPNSPGECPRNPDDCGEANLDVQVILAIAQNSPTTYWSMPSTDQEPFLKWIMDVANDNTAPLVHSISYGDVEGQGDMTETTRFCSEAAKLGARGITICVASGDDGVANFPARTDPSQCGFFPAFPASCPYITSVGGTMGPESNQPEVACTSNNGGLITTGGGFSNIFSQPSYQSSAVAQFLNGGNLPPSNMWNQTGRGYPDVAVLAHNYDVVIGGQTVQESGTSAASPAFAGMLTLINGARLQGGSSALGFVNPALYQAPSSVFNDITSGENNCAAGEPNPTCCQYGFTATTGWDPVSGLGSVNFPNLMQYLTGV